VGASRRRKDVIKDVPGTESRGSLPRAHKAVMSNSTPLIQTLPGPCTETFSLTRSATCPSSGGTGSLAAQSGRPRRAA
jgi:hypothetical protein